MFCRLRKLGHVYFLARGTVQIHDFESKPSRLDERGRKGGDGDIVDFTLRRLDAERAV